MNLKSKKCARNFQAFLLILSILFSGIMIWNSRADKAACVRETLELARAKVGKSIGYAESRLSVLERVGQALAKEIAETKPDAAALETMVMAVAEKNDFLNGICVAFRPFQAPSGKALYAPYYQKNRAGVFGMTYLEDVYDYADGSWDWFERPLEEGSVWHDPFYGKASGAFLVQYGVPVSIYHENDAVVSVNYSLEDIREYMAASELDGAGYSAIITSSGRFVYHPNDDLVAHTQTVFDIARATNNCNLMAASENAVKGLAGEVEYTSPVTGLEGWFLYRPLGISGWSVLSVIDRHDAQLGRDVLKKHGMEVSFALIVTCCLVCLVLVRRYWVKALLCSLGFVLGTGAIWYIVLNACDETGQVISSEMALNKFKKKYELECSQKHMAAPVYVPTGLFVQSIEFDGPNNVTMTGYVWQTYGIDSKIDKGLVFPEAVKTDLKKKYRKMVCGREVVGWYFEVTVRERFDYSKYPLDKVNLWIRMWHKNFYDNVVLVPDIASYQLSNPKALSGVESDIVTEGKHLMSSFFSYKRNVYKTDFGIKQGKPGRDVPELYYTIAMSRKFLDSFVAHLIPLIVVLSLLYFILLMSILEKSLALNVLAACSGLFFVAIFDHIGLRHSLSASGIVYLEYYYFVTYFALLSVSINSYFYAYHDNTGLVGFQNNIYPRVFYWPLITGVLYAVTLAVYY